MTQPTIQDKLLHLGFKSTATDASKFKRVGLDDLTIQLTDTGLEITHKNGVEQHKTHLHAQAILNNTSLENHVRGAVAQAFGAGAAKSVEDFPYSQEVLSSVQAAALKIH